MLNVSPPTSMRLYFSNLIHGVLNDVELELVYYFFISCSIAEISQVEMQHLLHDILDWLPDEQQDPYATSSVQRKS